MVMTHMRERRFIRVILWTLIAAFIGTIFIAWGMQSTFSSSQRDPNLVAQVGDETVTYEELSKTMEPLTQQLYTAGGDSDPDAEKNLRVRVLDQLVDDAILRDTANKLGLSVPDTEVAASLQREQAFQGENRRFNKEMYLRLLASNNLTPEKFEESLRRDLLARKIRSTLQDSVLYTPPELERFASLLNRQLKAAYVSIDLKKLEASIQAGREDLESYFESNRQRYDKPERAQLRHILVSLNEKATPQEEEIAKKSIEDYRQQILSKKATFAEVAKKYSMDNSNKDKGGELGWINRGMTVPAFEDAAFKLAKGELSKPVRTPFGFHLIQLSAYEKEKTASFSVVRADVEKAYRKENGMRAQRNLLRLLTEKLQAGTPLPEASKALKLESRTTAWFTADKGMVEFKKSQSAAETLATKHLGQWTGPFSLNDKQVLFQLVEERDRPLDKAAYEKDREKLQSKLMDVKQDAWMKSFLAAQRKTLNVRIYMDENPS